MRKTWLIVLSGILCALMQPLSAQDAISPDSISLDTLISDSTSNPEWYVAPEIPLRLRAPKSVKAAKCTMDSMLSFNVDSVLIETYHYEYDNAGRVSCEAVWTVNADGSQIGKEKQEYAYDAYENQVMTAVYDWDNAASRWHGTEKHEFVYDAEHRMISSIDYAWVTNKWKADNKKTWLYDAEERVTKYFEYKRNTSNNELEKFKGFEKAWDAESRQTLDILYTAASNNIWTAGTKKEMEYDANGNLTLYAVSTISNGAWIGSSKETWIYGGPSGEVTLYETFGWANNNWSQTLRAEKEYDEADRLVRIENYTFPNGVKTGTKKEEYTFTSAGKPASTITYAWVGGKWVGATNETWLYGGPSGQLTLHEKFSWVSNDWSKTLREETEYEGNNPVRVENYTYANGVTTGTQKVLTTYAGGKKTQILSFAWQNGDWVNSNKETWEFNGPSGKQTKHEKCEWGDSDWTIMVQENTIYDGNTTTIENYERLAGVWTGTKKEENTVVSGKPTQTIICAWENGAWVNSSKETWGYTSGKTTLYEKYLWENGAWVKSEKEVWAYEGSSQTLYEKYIGQNDAWVGLEKEVWGYTGTHETLHETYEWYNNDWSMTLRNISAFDADGNQTLVENYTGTNGTIKGIKKEEYTFKSTTAGLKQTSKITYTWNATKQKFVGKQWNVSDVDAVGNIIESCTYTYNTSKEAWVGTSTGRLLKTYNSDKNVIDEIVQKWNTTITPNGWLNNKQTTYEYYDKKNLTLKLISKWSKDINDWVGVTRQEWHYTDAGLNDSIRNFRFENDVWNPTTRTVKKYDENENNILTHNADWNGEKWVMSSMTRLDISDKTIDGIRQILQASWKCNSDSIWFGDQKDTVSYLTEEKLLFRARYSSWSNGNWIPAYKIEYEYDEAQRNTLQQRLEWTGGAWVGKYRYEKLYDSAGRELLNASYDGWDASRQDWVGNSKTTTTYNAEGKTQTQTTYRWRSSQWEPLFTNQYGYDAKGREVEQIVQMYLFENWTNTNRTLKEYEGNTLVKDNEYIWKSDQWVFASRNESYYDNDAQRKLRREVHGAWNSGVVTSFEHYYYIYSCDPCLIRFVNYDGTELESKTMDKGQMPSYTGNTPTKPEDVEFTYEFSGWTPKIVEVKGSATYTATYTPIKKSYTITWLNDDNSLIEETTVEYGKMPTPPTATKPATAEFTYTFNGWTPGVGMVTGDATYTATYKETKNSYAITWLKDDDSLLEETTVEYGKVPEHVAPTKENTAEWTYTFKGWNPTPVEVTGVATYKATFNAYKNSYTITWKDEEGKEIGSDVLAYGETPKHEDLTKENTAEWTYTFKGWTPSIIDVVGDATYTAVFDQERNKYTIKFVNYDGSELQSSKVEYGELPKYESGIPTKPADAQDTYTFIGWDKDIVEVDGDATYTATFRSDVNSYTITWLKDDNTLLEETTVEYGKIPTHAAPTKENTAEWTYTFLGWDPTPVAVTENATYKAQFTATKKEYTITWKNEDGSVIASETLEYGKTPSHAAPTKENTAEWTYTFKGWTPSIVDVVGDAEYTAVFEQEKNQYTIKFVNYDGEELQSSKVAYGEMPKYEGTEPSKPATAEFTYEFNGWSPQVETVTGDATYIATYRSDVNSYTITWLNEDNSLLEETTVEYGKIPTHADATKQATAEHIYTFSGWTPAIEPVTGTATYKATFTEQTRLYTITWLNEDGSEISHETLEYGATPKHADLSKDNTAEYTYKFTGWTPAVTTVTADAAYTATFEATKNKYTVTFLNEDGTELQSSELEYGVKPTCAEPSKQGTEEYTYTFAGWTPEVVAVTADATYKATFSATKNKFTITWLNDDKSQIDQTTVEYGSTPAHADIYKESSDKWTYTFVGWTPKIVATTGDATYTAVFDSIENIILYHITVTADDTAHGAAGFIYADSSFTKLLTEGNILSGAWIELQAIAAENWHFVQWSDGDTVSVRQVEVTSDMQYVASFEPNCGDYPTLPVVSLYDWLLMLDVRSIHAMGYTFAEEDVAWYRVHGEPDKLNAGVSGDDERLGTGYSFTLDESFANTGDYYAMVDVSSSPIGVPCTDMMRSQIVHFVSTKANAAPLLAPVMVRPNEPQQVHRLNPDAPTTIMIYDISGQLLRTISEEGVDRMDLQAESVAGCYQLVIQNGDLRTVLRYIVVQ